MKAPPHRPFDFGLSVVVIGHRGAPLVAAENTPASFAAAAAAGATWVELDARRSADGVVVAHDPCLADGTALLSLSTDALREHGIWPLGEVLSGLPAGLGVDVELKNLPGEPDYDEEHHLAALAAAPVHAEAAAGRPVMVSSFNPATLLALPASTADVPLGFLHGPTLRAPAGLAIARELPTQVLCPSVSAPGLDAPLVAAAHAAGLRVLVWTVDDPATARSLAAIGVDALCTNDPAGLVTALAEESGSTA